MISVICCYNDLKKYNEICKKSIEEQKGVSFELIAIDNTEGKYKSAAEALNYAMLLVKYEYIVCIHQDFGFNDQNALKSISEYLSNYNVYDVVGGAGAVLNTNSRMVRKIAGRNRTIISYLKPSFNWKEKQVIEVESIDECFFAFNFKLWKEHNFDERICFAWDLYSVEMCLYARKKGGRCYVIPIEGFHLSCGNITTDFYRSLYLIGKKYRNDFSYIVTTCVVFKTGSSDLWQIKWLLLVNSIRRIKSRLIKEM